MRQYLKPAVDNHLIVLKNPENPSSPNQKYGLSLKGKTLYYDHRDEQYYLQNDPDAGQTGLQNDPQKEIVIRAIKQNPSIRRVNWLIN